MQEQIENRRKVRVLRCVKVIVVEQGDTVDSKNLSALSKMQGKRGGNALRPAPIVAKNSRHSEDPQLWRLDRDPFPKDLE